MTELDTASPPDRLWIWRPGLYLDENDRPWVTLTIEEEAPPKVLMRQDNVPRGEAILPSRLPPGLLPIVWQLYPGRRYRSSDSNFWRIVCHIRVCGTEYLLLERMPQP